MPTASERIRALREAAETPYEVTVTELCVVTYFVRAASEADAIDAVKLGEFDDYRTESCELGSDFLVEVRGA